MEVPFKFGKLAENDNFVDRVEDRRKLKQLLSSGINVMLVSPRRRGKSSLVLMATRELMDEDKRVRVCYIDAMGIHTEAEFYRVFAREVISCTSSVLEKRLDYVRRFLRNIKPGITLSSNSSETMSFDLKFDIDDVDEYEILNLPQKIASEKGLKIIVCIDEFQQLAQIPQYKSLEGKMRSAWQSQQNVSYCLYGSKRHMMLDIFNNSSNPFYRFGQIFFLKKIPVNEWIPFIMNKFKLTGKKISKDYSTKICETVRCLSWYVQQYCYFVWSNTSREVTSDILDLALAQMIEMNAPMYENDTENLTSAQFAMLKAVVNGEYKLNSASVVKKYDLGNAQTITRNKKILQEMDFFEKVEGVEKYEFCDPVFEIWFKEKYMN